jgi:UDP-galactopyranose mutase
MNTFSQIFGVTTPEEAKAIIEEQRSEIVGEPKNLEEQAISLVGREIYTKLVKGYTEKQWGRDCKDLPAFIIKRLPVRYTYDNNYFNDTYQGIPIGGYNKIIDKLLEGIEVRLNTDFLLNKDEYMSLCEKVIYTGTIDSFFDYSLGELDYRSLRFETEILDIPEFQPVAVVNYNERQIPYTRIIEHKHFEFGTQEKTVITREYPADWQVGDEPYYPVNDQKNNVLYEEYKRLAQNEKNVIFGGRLGQYKYYDMDKCIESALALCKEELGNE